MKLFGKRVGIHTYWHITLHSVQPQEVQHCIARACELAGLILDQDFNVIKFASCDQALSLLDYPNFFTEPFPALKRGWTIDLNKKTVKPRNYKDSKNPPILHRKELFIPQDYPNIATFQALTAQAESLGLFAEPKIIGFQSTWQSLIAGKGYILQGHKLLPIAIQSDASNTQANDLVQRHRTALTRYNLSTPFQALARFGFLDGKHAIFDYGCGKGDDIQYLLSNNISAQGWDPYFCPNNPKQAASIVNLGFVINVIEALHERCEALQSAWELAQELLVVSAMLYNQNAFKSQQYNDGVLTARNTFQKYYTQAELKQFIEQTLQVEALAIGPGLFFIFRDRESEQRFFLSRQRSQGNLLRLNQRERIQRIVQPSKRDQRYQARLELIIPLRRRWLELGRSPHQSEIDNALQFIEEFGSLSKALRFVETTTEAEVIEQARSNRIADLQVYFALYTFSRREPYKYIEPSLQRDIKVFFTNYPKALEHGRLLLFQLSQTEAIQNACITAAEQKLGYLDEKLAFYVMSTKINCLEPILRIYIACATLLYGDPSQADLIKIHTKTGKLSLMRYDDFVGKPIPHLLERVKIKFRSLDFDYFQYNDLYEPTYLYLKSRYMPVDSENYTEQLAFDEKLEQLNLFDFKNYGPSPEYFSQTLKQARWEINGFNLQRSSSIPMLEDKCGQFLTYKNLIQNIYIADPLTNVPKQPDSYTALYDLSTQILDPVIDYFGMIEITLGFCSYSLAKTLPQLQPKTDQHVACELNRLGNLICTAQGAAVNFIVKDEDMQEVAAWIRSNTHFDCLHYYGIDQSIHVSIGPLQRGMFKDLST